MTNKEALDKIIQDKYKDLSSQLGDCHFKIKKLKDQIKTIEEELESLNSAYPLSAATLAKVELEEADDEQSGD